MNLTGEIERFVTSEVDRGRFRAGPAQPQTLEEEERLVAGQVVLFGAS